jgi:ribokinase
MNHRIAVVGDLSLHWTMKVDRFPDAGETSKSSAADWHLGGHAGRQAQAAAKLGGRVLILGNLGKDVFGELLVRALDDVQVDTSGLGRDAHSATSQTFSWINSSGQTHTVVAEGANHHLRGDVLKRHIGLIAGCGSLLAGPGVPASVLESAACLAKGTGAMVFLDPAPHTSISSDVLQWVDYLLLNEDSLAILTNAPLCDFSHDQAAVKARELRKRGGPTVIVKLGPLGALLVKDDLEHLWRPPHGASGDVTVAGDLFDAAFIVALAHGKSELSAGKYAVAAATCHLWRPGHPPVFPTSNEVDHLLKPPARGKRSQPGG